jgi:hypothetical protein
LAVLTDTIVHLFHPDDRVVEQRPTAYSAGARFCTITVSKPNILVSRRP